MPIPKPWKHEDKSAFMERCMKNERMIREYGNRNQRYTVCNSSWEKKHDDK